MILKIRSYIWRIKVNREETIEVIKECLPADRFKHSLAVAVTAEKLARKEGLAVDKAYLAGLLHDYAKGYSEEELKRLARISSWYIDEEEMSIYQLLHAPVAAYLVEKELGIDDSQILEAIRYHTIGSPDMGKLAVIIYIADFIEPSRDFSGIDKIRKEVDQGLDYGILAITNHILRYHLDNNRLIHPNTLALRNAYLRRIYDE
ncbi:MAG: HD domain-containing protein [Firmicutes bacterium]|nr:HD domain-containing protein [Bacillota bacterium]